MPKAIAHKWQFTARLRRNAFGWRSSRLAVERIKEAVSEIQRIARSDPLLAAEGAMLFLEKVSPALEQVDSSSGALGTAVNRAIEALVKIIAAAPADAKLREKWLDRLWEAHMADQIPYIECLGDHWGELCGSKEVAAAWADQLVQGVELSWSPDPKLRGYFHGTMACLSALLRAGRYHQLLALLEKAPRSLWHYRQRGVKALLALGRKADALRYAEDSRGLNDSPIAIARACEEILLSSGMAGEAYARYALTANLAGSFLATYRAIARKYPHRKPAEILADLVASTPGEEGKWFAAAKDAELYAEAILLANRTPCDPHTLIRAARDYAEKHPAFALEAGLAALRWLAAGYGYEITGADVLAAHAYTMKAAENAGLGPEAQARMRELLESAAPGADFVTRILGRQLGIA